MCLLVIYICSPTRYAKCFNKWVYSSLMLARHFSDLTGPSSGAFYTSCIRGLWYVVIRVLLDTSSRYKAVGRTVLSTTLSSSTRITTYQSLQIQLIQNAPDDGPMRSETCRAKLKCWLKLIHWDHIVYLVGLHIYYKMIHGPYNVKLLYGICFTFYKQQLVFHYNVYIFSVEI